MTKITQWLVVPVMCLALCACGSSGDNVAMSDLENPLQDMVTEPPLAGDVLDDGETLACDAEFDHAELLFTESDRQWFCSVSSAEFASSDEVYFSRNGTAVFTRFGVVYWNRNLQTDEINIVSPLISSFVMRQISSANTTLQFTIDAEDEADQQYDCVLVDRADLS